MSDIANLSVNKPWLMLGDCVERMREIPDGFVDLTVTSPPYDRLRSYHGYSFDFEGVAQELCRVTKPGGVVVWIVGDATVKGSETGTSFRQALYFKDVCGFNLADTMIYHKTDISFPRHGHRKYPGAFEYIFVFSKGPVKTFNIIRDRENKLAGKRYSGTTVRQEDGTKKPMHSASARTIAHFGARSNVWGYSTGFGKSAAEAEAYQHPAIFPEALARDHIVSWSNPGDTVLDPFMGSGTTGKMAVLAGRKFIGCETSEQYLNAIARPRIAAAIATLSQPAQLGGLFDAQAAD